jgi:hypothetical protein
VSSPTWTPRAVGSEALPARLELWRAVEAQHVASTLPLVDSLAEQQLLEEILEQGKPPLPEAARQLHYLLATPFRYAPPPGGSRFRGPADAGVFYAADAIRTACAELGYWRWRHLADSPGLSAMPSRPQTVFPVKVATTAVDLRGPPFVAERRRFTDPVDYAACQSFGRVAREAGVGAIRYESVRDPLHGGACAVLTPAAFASPRPGVAQTWMLSVTRTAVVWQRSAGRRREAFEFRAADWSPPSPRKPGAAP